jgi:hypothetical protein
MPYVSNPFNPDTPSVNQVSNELQQANINFSILAQFCQGNDPNTFMLKPSVIPPVGGGYKNVDLSSATSDYFLQVGEQAVINFTNTASVPLHIATTSGTYYELDIIPAVNYNASGTTDTDGVRLLPNNTTYASSINNISTYAHVSLNLTTYYYTSSGDSSFRLTHQYIKLVPHLRAVINNYTGFKSVFAQYIHTRGGFDNINYLPFWGLASCMWVDTSTAWTSLGIIAFLSNVSGTILVRRLK